MEEWKEYKIGDLFSHFKSGKGIKADEIYSSGKYPVFGGNGLRGYTYQNNFNGDCAIIGRQGAFCGNVRYFKGKAYMTEHAIVAVANENNNTRFLAYLLGLMKLGRFSGQSAQPGLSVTELTKQPIVVPSLSTQKRIASILSSLDDKIELNRRINENLEQQAQALFKSWFVDFEPFKDGLFVDSELGKIPEGWQVGTFKDIIHSTLSGDWGKECKQGNHIQKVFCIRGADIPNIKRGDKGNMPTRFIIEKNFQSKALMDGDMVIEVSGGSPTQATGRACRISRGLLDKYNHSIVCTNFCRAIKPLSQYSSFLYYMWEMFYNQGIMFSYENGTTGIKNLDINGLIQKEPIIIPPVEIALEFEKITQIYYEKIQSNGVESEMLSLLRDTLLPRLMSGELEIKDNSYD